MSHGDFRTKVGGKLRRASCLMFVRSASTSWASWDTSDYLRVGPIKDRGGCVIDAKNDLLGGENSYSEKIY